MIESLADIVPTQAAEYPDVEAVRSGGVSLTYAELDQRCSALAVRLRDLGVRPGDRVGVWVHKSVESMAAVHAVLRLGAAYVPLDPAASAGVLARVVADAGVGVLVTNTRQARIAELMAEMPELHVLESSSVDDATLEQVPAQHVSPDAMAYLMYTSGSTGQPKGIVHTHASALAYATRASELYGLRRDDLLANIAPLHFDQSTFELFSGPIAGAASLFVPEPYLRLPASLSQLVQDERPTVWYSVPSVLRMLVDRGALQERDLSSLRWVLFGGEVYPPAALAQLMQHCPKARFSNVYGPAEVNQCTYHHLDSPPATDRAIPIGRAWDATELAIDDGELLVRTDTVMAGYWQRPELTDAAFVVGPDGSKDWYATGDLVDRQADGELVFVGRRDNQVKVRGQRVELEAVDAALRALPGVEEGVGVVGEGPDGLPVVEGRVILRPEITLSDEASNLLAATLPSHAVPHRLVVVGSLPRTSNGKVDRVAAALELEVNPCLS